MGGLFSYRSEVAVFAVAALTTFPVEAVGQEVFPAPENPVSMAAVRALVPVNIDGRLDEQVWDQAPPVTGFVQAEPRQGALATEQTVVRVSFDDAYLYVSAVCYDDGIADGLRVLDLRRDFDEAENDLFGVVLDPVRDQRNAQVFQVNPQGVVRDQQVTDGSRQNVEWDAVVEVRTSTHADRWVVEMAIPWESLRYRRGESDWGVNFVRSVRRLGETSGWSPWPRAYGPYRMEYAGLLRGLEPPPPSTNLRAQPYVVANTDRRGSQQGFFEDASAKVGLDAKWAVTPNTVVDLTVNTDFAQADADRQVVNLSRFSVFFPEKRGFFLESADMFYTGATIDVVPFFSRRIGLDDRGGSIPLDVGARVISRSEAGGWGGLMVRQRGVDGTPAATFGVGRVTRNVGPTSRVGLLATVRRDDASADQGARTNTVLAADGLVRFSPKVTLSTMTSTSLDSRSGDQGWTGRAWISYRSNRGYLGHVQSFVTQDYDPGVGFVARRDLLLSSPAGYLDWRPDWRPRWLKSLEPGFISSFYHRLSDRRFQEGWLEVYPVFLSFVNGANVQLSLRKEWQRLSPSDVASFRPLGVELASGDYDYLRFVADAQTDLSKPYSLSGVFEAGPYLNGRLTSLRARARVSPGPRASLALAYELNRVSDLGIGSIDQTGHLLAPELRLAWSPRLQLNAFYQYNTLAERAYWNLRMSYEFSPLSYVFLVFNEDRHFVDNAVRASDPARYRSSQQGILKITFLRQM